jgi:hypothetical protein
LPPFLLCHHNHKNFQDTPDWTQFTKMNNHHSHVPTPTLGPLETNGSTTSREARGSPHNTNDRFEGTTTSTKRMASDCSVRLADHRLKLKFGLLAPGAVDTDNKRKRHKISVAISCRSDENGGYIFRGDLCPGTGFAEEGGQQRFDRFQADFASVIEQPDNLRTFHSLGPYESLRRPLAEQLRVKSSRFITRAAATYDRQLLASVDFAVVLERMVNISRIRQPEDGFDFFAVQPSFYEYAQQHRDGETVNQGEESKTQETRRKYPDPTLRTATIVKDMLKKLESTSKNLPAAKWEYGGTSVAMIPLEFNRLPDHKGKTRPQAEARRDRRAKSSKGTSDTTPGSHSGFEARPSQSSASQTPHQHQAYHSSSRSHSEQDQTGQQSMFVYPERRTAEITFTNTEDSHMGQQIQQEQSIPELYLPEQEIEVDYTNENDKISGLDYSW